MGLSVNSDRASASSRLTAIRLAMLTLRCMENWRRNVRDYDSAMVLVAVVAITAERLTRTDLPEEKKDLREPIAQSWLAPCNVSSIAAATGLNRETARRKVNELIEQGFLVRSPRGVISFAPGHLQRETTLELIRSQLDSFARTASELMRDGVIEAG